MPRAVILSGALGSGHDMVSEVVVQSLEAHDWQVSTLDCMAMLGSRGAKLGDRVFRRVTAMPGLYDGLHFAHFRTGSWLVRAIDREATKRLVPAVKRELEAQPADLLFATFATGASVAAKLRTDLPRVRSAVLCTDVDPYWLWVWDEIDLYLVTSQAAAAAVRRFVPKAHIQVVPPPVRPAFYQAPDQFSARRALGIPEDAGCVLLMGGGWGLGPVAELAAALGASGTHVLAVAGHNETLRRSLEQLDRDHVHPFGFTDRIPELMAASDVVMTTPGATTCSEARVIGRHLVVLDVFPGHGRENLQHELELGAADACGPALHELEPVVEAVLERMKRPLPTVIRPPDEWPVAFAGALQSLGVSARSPQIEAAG